MPPREAAGGTGGAADGARSEAPAAKLDAARDRLRREIPPRDDDE